MKKNGGLGSKKQSRFKPNFKPSPPLPSTLKVGQLNIGNYWTIADFYSAELWKPAVAGEGEMKIRLEGFGPPTFGSVDRRSIQLSYRRRIFKLRQYNKLSKIVSM